MKKALIVYGSTTGNTEAMAETVGKALADTGIETELRDVNDASIDDLNGPADLLVLGCPAYGDDEIELQEDFSDFYQTWDNLKLEGKKFAVFAPGDSSYDFFCGSVDLLEETLEAAGGNLVSPGLKIDGDPAMPRMKLSPGAPNWPNTHKFYFLERKRTMENRLKIRFRHSVGNLHIRPEGEFNGPAPGH